MSYDKRQLAQHFKGILDNTTDDDASVATATHLSILGGGGTIVKIGNDLIGRMPDDHGPTLYIRNEGVQLIDAFVSECLKDDTIESRVGKQPIVKTLHEIIRRLWPISSQVDIDRIIKDDILNALKDQIKHWIVRIPIANLNIKEPLSIGDVRFTHHDDGVISNASIVLGLKDIPGSDRVSQKAAMLNVMSEISKQGSAWAETKVRAHDGRVEDIAKATVDNAIGVIRAFTHVFHPHSLRVAFGLPYEMVGGNTGIVASNEEGFVVHNCRSGFTVPFEITPHVISTLRDKCAFAVLSGIVGREWDSLTTLERAVRVALLWLSRSVIVHSQAESLTCCTVAIERLVIVEGENATVDKFADRVALLIGDTKDGRKAIHKIAKRLYDIRSKVVHAGLSNVDVTDRCSIEGMAIDVLVETANRCNTLQSHEALRDWLHDRKME